MGEGWRGVCETSSCCNEGMGGVTGVTDLFNLVIYGFLIFLIYMK